MFCQYFVQNNVLISDYASFSPRVSITAQKLATHTVNGHRKQQLSYTENQQTLFLFPIFIDARLTNNKKIQVSSQVFYVPPSRSGDAGIGTEDQHSLVVPERCLSRALHDGLTLQPRQYIQRKEVNRNPNVPFCEFQDMVHGAMILYKCTIQ